MNRKEQFLENDKKFTELFGYSAVTFNNKDLSLLTIVFEKNFKY